MSYECDFHAAFHRGRKTVSSLLEEILFEANNHVIHLTDDEERRRGLSEMEFSQIVSSLRNRFSARSYATGSDRELIKELAIELSPTWLCANYGSDQWLSACTRSAVACGRLCMMSMGIGRYIWSWHLSMIVAFWAIGACYKRGRDGDWRLLIGDGFGMSSLQQVGHPTLNLLSRIDSVVSSLEICYGAKKRLDVQNEEMIRVCSACLQLHSLATALVALGKTYVTTQNLPLINGGILSWPALGEGSLAALDSLQKRPMAEYEPQNGRISFLDDKWATFLLATAEKYIAAFDSAFLADSQREPGDREAKLRVLWQCAHNFGRLARSIS